MSQPNRKYKRLEALFSEARQVTPDPGIAPPNQEVDDLRAQVAELESKLAEQKPVKVQEPLTPVQAPVSHPITVQPVNKPSTGTKADPSGGTVLNSRSIFWSSIVLLAASGINSIVAFKQASNSGVWQAWLEFGVVALFFVTVLISVFLSRRGRIHEAIGLLIGGFLFTIIVRNALTEDLGVVYGLIVIAVTSVLAFINLPRKTANRLAIASIVIGALIVLFDLVVPPYRQPAPPALLKSLPYVASLVTLILLSFLVRQAITGNIRTKMITAFVAVAVLSMGIVAFIAQRSLSTSLTSNIGGNLAELASVKAIEIGQAVDREMDVLKALAFNKDIQEAAASANELTTLDQAEIARLDQQWRSADAANNNADPLVLDVLYNGDSNELRRFQKEFPQHVEVFLTDRQGVNIAATNRTSDYYQADEEWWQIAYQEGTFIGQPEYDESSKTIAIIMARAIQDRSGKVTGVLRTTVNFEVLADSLREGRFGQTGHTDIYLPGGQELVLKTLGDGTLGMVMQEAGVDISLLTQSTEPFTQIPIHDVPVLAGQAAIATLGDTDYDKQSIDGLGWHAVVIQDQAEALQPVTTQTRNLIILFAVIITLVIAAAIFLARVLTNPFLHLNTVAEKVAAGDLTAEAKVETSDEIGALAATFNYMTSQLRNLFGSLEQRVLDRTHDLELASEVGRTITQKVANINEMLTSAAEMIRARFDLYYAQVYLTDPAGRTLILRAGTGEVGEELLKRGHRLLIDSGSLNGQAVLQKEPVIVADTLQSPNFKPNSLLPNTRSEMAVPLIVGDKVIGVLDMQSERSGTLNETNLPAFKALAGQLAVALQNASLFAQAEEARAEVEAQMRDLTEHGWKEFMNAIDRGQRVGYAYEQAQVSPLKDVALTPMHAELSVSIPIQVTGAKVGMIQIANESGRNLSGDEQELLEATANQLAQHIENLRLLAQAEGYRSEAEQAVRRLTREGWESYLQVSREIEPGYIFDLTEVKSLSVNNSGTSNHALKKPLIVSDEIIGELGVDSELNSEDSLELLAAVAEQLSSHIENLRLSELNEKRAHELETVATVSSTTSTLLDPDKLLQTVVDLTKERFGLYHAHIYLADDAWKTLLLAAGAGEVGRQMVADGWNIPMDHTLSIVANAARKRKSVIANSISRAKHTGFLSNNLLPDTRSEMAVPMIVGDKLLGVFDVQADTANYFTEEDANIYTTLAAQVAVALQNARLYMEQAATVTQLRELDRLKSSFLANMSHELRTPLNSILGFSDVMLEELDGPLTENMQNDLGLIQKNGQHLLNLINDVLDMAKIEAGRMNLNPEKFRVHEILEEVTSITSTLASEKNLSLFIENDSDKDVEIFADRTRLRQVMINLVNNSIKFTEKGKVSIRVTGQNEHVLICVKDTGIGIPADKLEDVFQEFAQVDTSTTRKAGGTGLGLPISRRLIAMHGGRLWAESSGIENEGSTFFVELPLEAQLTEAVEKVVR